MKLGNLTGADKAWLPVVIAGAGVLVYHGFISEEQASWITTAGPILIPMVIQGILAFATTNKS